MKRQHKEKFGELAPAQIADELQLWQGLNIAMNQSMQTDESVFIFGEDVGLYGGR